MLTNRKITRREAIRVLMNATDIPEERWREAMEESMNKKCATVPDIYDVMEALGVGKRECEDA